MIDQADRQGQILCAVARALVAAFASDAGRSNAELMQDVAASTKLPPPDVTAIELLAALQAIGAELQTGDSGFPDRVTRVHH